MSSSMTESNFRLPRSVSEQESMMAGPRVPQKVSAEELPICDMMDDQTREIFDDQVVTDLLETIQRTQRVLNMVRSYDTKSRIISENGFSKNENTEKSSSTLLCKAATTKIPVTASQAKIIIVKSIVESKAKIASLTEEGAATTLEEVAPYLEAARTAISLASNSIPDQAKAYLDHHLNQAQIAASTFTSSNVVQLRETLSHHLDKALTSVLPAPSVRSKQASRPKSLARKIIEYTDKNPPGNYPIEHHSSKTKRKKKANASPPTSPPDEAECLEKAINEIRANCPKVELILFISPIEGDLMKKPCNLQITAVNRENNQILGNFLIPECRDKVLDREGFFDKYFTVRVSQDIKYFEKDIASLMRHLITTLSAKRKQIPCKPSNRYCIIEIAPPKKTRLVKHEAIPQKETIRAFDDFDKEPTILELLDRLSKNATPKDLDLLFQLAENHNFQVYAHPDYKHERSVYICEFFTSTQQFIGTTRLLGENILKELRKRPNVISNFEIVVDIIDIVLPVRVKKVLVMLFKKAGLISLYDRLGMFLFDIYKSLTFGDVLQNDAIVE